MFSYHHLHFLSVCTSSYLTLTLKVLERKIPKKNLSRARAHVMSLLNKEIVFTY